MFSFLEFLIESINSDEFEAFVANKMLQLDKSLDKKYKVIFKTQETRQNNKYSDIQFLARSNSASTPSFQVEAKINFHDNLMTPGLKFTDDGKLHASGYYAVSALDAFIDKVNKEHRNEISRCYYEFVNFQKKNAAWTTPAFARYFEQHNKAYPGTLTICRQKMSADELLNIVKEWWSIKKGPTVAYLQTGAELFVINENFDPLNLIDRGVPVLTANSSGSVEVSLRFKARTEGAKHGYNIIPDFKFLADTYNRKSAVNAFSYVTAGEALKFKKSGK